MCSMFTKGTGKTSQFHSELIATDQVGILNVLGENLFESPLSQTINY